MPVLASTVRSYFEFHSCSLAMAELIRDEHLLENCIEIEPASSVYLRLSKARGGKYVLLYAVEEGYSSSSSVVDQVHPRYLQGDIYVARSQSAVKFAA
jgi:hypothetical protein